MACAIVVLPSRGIQLVDPEDQSLRIFAQCGFDAGFMQTFERVAGEQETSCARVLRTRQPCWIEDVETDERYAPHRHIAELAGFRAVQSIPLLDSAGKLVGVLSTHFRTKRRFTARDEQLRDLLARQAAELIESRRQHEQRHRAG